LKGVPETVGEGEGKSATLLLGGLVKDIRSGGRKVINELYVLGFRGEGNQKSF